MDNRQQKDNTKPFQLEWHLTAHCNLGCVHCHRDGPRATMGREALVAILDDYGDFLLRIGRPGHIRFCGGEPFLSRHLFDLAARAHRKNISTSIATNGTLVTKALAARLREAGCGHARVSLDGIQTTHDVFRRPGSFQQALDGMAILREAGFEVTIAMTLSKVNADEAFAVVRLSENVADRVDFTRLVPVGVGTFLRKECLEPEELRSLMAGLIAFCRERRVDLSLTDPLWNAYLNPRRAGEPCAAGCTAGIDGLSVDANGDVFPCRYLPIKMGSMNEQSLVEIWESPFPRALRDRDLLNGKCGACRLRFACGGCRAIAFAFTGDPLAEDPQCFRAPTILESAGKGLAASLRNVRDLVFHSRPYT